MRILVGVQGTGNGHISRCSALAEAFKHTSATVDFLVSGRSRAALFDMEQFGDYQWREGLTFQVSRGRINIPQTLQQNQWRTFWQDTHALALHRYDLIVSDYEPVTAWAAKRQGRACIGIGRQFAFYHGCAQLPINLPQRAMLRAFAPVTQAVGMHWTPLGDAVLPPVIHQRGGAGGWSERDYLVYLPFESLADIRRLLAPFSGYRFHIFHPQASRDQVGHLHYYAPSRAEFARVLSAATGVIANAGFETCCESLAQGKKLLVRPLAGQFEQGANARSLQQHGFAAVMKTLSRDALAAWLVESKRIRCHWPNVAQTLANWLADGASIPIADVSAALWRQTEQPLNSDRWQLTMQDTQRANC